METWVKMFDDANAPQDSDAENFINNQLWGELNTFIKQKYSVKPLLSYSNCSAQPGWNYKYKRKGKALCTLYPEKGFFITLIVISEKEIAATEAVLPLLTDYTKNLYKNSPLMKRMGKWLMISVKDNDILRDVKELLRIKTI